MRIVVHLFVLAMLLVCSERVTVAEDAAPTHLRGTIAVVGGNAFTITASNGAKMKLTLLPDAKILVATRASLVDVVPGTLVGIANTGPNGLQDALEVHIFPDATGTAEAQSHWDLGKRSRMTIGTARAKSESYDGQNLTLTVNGQESSIQVRPNTPVVRLLAGSRADLKAGAAIFVRDGEVQPDGSTAAGWIIVGREGLTPPM